MRTNLIRIHTSDMQTNKFNLAEFHKSFIDLTDRILPALTTAEQLVYLQIFSRSVGVGEKTCRLSYRDFSDLTGQVIQTIKTAIDGLISRGYLHIERQSGPRSARTYRINLPSPAVSKLTRLQRDVTLLINGARHDFASPQQDLIDRLTTEDKEYLDILLKSLPPDKEAQYREKAVRTAKDGENAHNHFLKLVIMNEFGPMRLNKYVF